MKTSLFAALALFLFISCDRLIPERDDVVRFDFVVNADSTSGLLLNDTVVSPYETDELDQYKSERDRVKEFNIQKVEFRFYTFREDHPDTKLKGNVTLTSNAGTVFVFEMFDVGNEYRDSENHEAHLISANGVEGNEAYDLLSEEVIAVDEFTLNMSDVGGVVDTLSCDMSVYVHYSIKAS